MPWNSILRRAVLRHLSKTLQPPFLLRRSIKRFILMVRSRRSSGYRGNWRSRGSEFQSWHWILHGSFFTFIWCGLCNVVWKDQKINLKSPWMAGFKNFSFLWKFHSTILITWGGQFSTPRAKQKGIRLRSRFFNSVAISVNILQGIKSILLHSIVNIENFEIIFNVRNVKSKCKL